MKLPSFAQGIASFNKEHFKKSNIPQNAIIEEKIACTSINDLMTKYKISDIDLLQIDTEGYDKEIIFDIDFTKISPSIIRFEHQLGQVMDESTLLHCIDKLRSFGYDFSFEAGDITAYKMKDIIKAWIS